MKDLLGEFLLRNRFFLAQTIKDKPGSSGSPEFFMRAIANNGAAESKELLSARFQIIN